MQCFVGGCTGFDERRNAFGDYLAVTVARVRHPRRPASPRPAEDSVFKRPFPFPWHPERGARRA